MTSPDPDPRFPVQRVARAEWIRTTAANAAADHLAGHEAVIDAFLAAREEPEFRVLHRRLRSWPERRRKAYVEACREHTLQFLVLMLTGACNADCPICFTDRRRKAGELEPKERDVVLRQARELGARFVYVPGEGEPTIDPGFWQFLETCRRLGLHAVVFTNGILFADNRSSRRYWGIEPDEAVRWLRELPVSFYVKFWSCSPDLAAEMLQVDPARLPYEHYDGALVPAALARLLRMLPRWRVGIEVVAERRNADEVAERIVPFARTHRVSRIVEMIQHNGRVMGDWSYDPTPAQAARVRPLLSPTSCALATCKAVVTSRGFLSPRIAILEHQIPGQPADVRSGELFDLLHRTEYVVARRYDIARCLCEQVPAQLARMPKLVQLSPNVVPPALAPIASAVHAREAGTVG